MIINYPSNIPNNFLYQNAQWFNYRYVAQNVAPHSYSVRVSYTVPAGYALFIETVSLSVVRITAASTAGKIFANVTINASNQWENSIAAAEIIENTVGAFRDIHYSPQAHLQAGHYLSINTSDASTGGTVDYMISVLAYLYTP